MLERLNLCGNQERYCVIIDAGSTGSRVHVYRFHTTSGGLLPRVVGTGGVLKNRTPLSAFLEDPLEGAASLIPLIKHAAGQVQSQLCIPTLSALQHKQFWLCIMTFNTKAFSQRS